MKSFHISNDTVRRCRARKGNCPLNSGKDDSTLSPHFDDKNDAREYLEEILENKYGTQNAVTKKDRLKSEPQYEPSENWDFSEYVVSDDKVVSVNGDQIQFDNGLVSKKRKFSRKSKDDHQKVADLLNKSLTSDLSSDEVKELQKTVESLWKPHSSFVKNIVKSAQDKNKSAYDYTYYTASAQVHNDVKNGWAVGTTAKYNRINRRESNSF